MVPNGSAHSLPTQGERTLFFFGWIGHTPGVKSTLLVYAAYALHRSDSA